jgi:acyl carrier protein
MSETELFGKIREALVNEFDVASDAVTPEARLAEDLDLDSIDAVDLLIKMKQYTTNGKVDPSLFKNARTVGDVAAILLPLVQA